MSKTAFVLWSALGFVLAFLLPIGCSSPDSDGKEVLLDIPIDAANDSLLGFDTLIVQVTNGDSTFVQEVFHGPLTDPKQLLGLVLDSRVGREFTVRITGIKDGRVGMNREYTVRNLQPAGSKDVPIRDTATPDSTLPELILPVDTSVREGDTLRFRIEVRRPWGKSAIFALKGHPDGARLDTTGTASEYANFLYAPTFDQGRSEPYFVTISYATANRQVERTLRVTVHNVNRPPRLSDIPDQRVKEGETFSFQPQYMDPDGDSLSLMATNLPAGAEFKAGLFTWKPAAGQAGNYSVRITASDGRASDVRDILITVGNVPPPPPISLKIVFPAQDSSVNTPNFTVRYLLNGVELKKSFTLTEGSNRLRVDTAIQGRAAFDTVTVTLDRVPPARPYLSGRTPVATLRPSWTWRSGGNGGSGLFRYNLDEDDMDNATPSYDTTFMPPADLTPGPHSLSVQEKDMAGNWSSVARWTIVIDLTPPNAPRPGPETSALTNSRRPTWHWSSGGGGNGVFRFKLDDGDLRTGATVAERTSFTPGLDLGEGGYTLFIQESDSAGNWSSATLLHIRIDITPPAQPVFDATPYSPVASLRPTWTWKGGGGGNGIFRFKLDDSDLTSDSDTLAGKAFRPASDLPEGRHELWIQERDSTGNWSPPGSRNLYVMTRGRVGEAGITPGSVRSANLAIDKIGTLYVAFTDGVTERDPYGTGAIIKKLSRNGWVAVGDPITKGTFTWPYSFALNPEGVPHVVVTDSAGNGHVLNPLRGYWHSLGREPVFSDGMGEPNLGESALAFTQTSLPFVAFRDAGRESRATVIHMDEMGVWGTAGPRGFSNGFSIYFQLAIDKRGAPIVSYLENDGDEDMAALKVRKFQSGRSSWEDIGKFPVRSFGNQEFSMLLDANDSLFIALSTHETGGAGEVMKFNGVDWIRVGKPLYPFGSNSGIIIKGDKAGRKYVAYSDEANEYRVTIKALIGGEWKACGPEGFTPPASGDPQMEFDENGIPYVLVQDRSNGRRAAVYRTGFDP